MTPLVDCTNRDELRIGSCHENILVPVQFDREVPNSDEEEPGAPDLKSVVKFRASGSMAMTVASGYVCAKNAADSPVYPPTYSRSINISLNTLISEVPSRSVSGMSVPGNAAAYAS
jgi:hypothetical protein